MKKFIFFLCMTLFVFSNLDVMAAVPRLPRTNAKGGNPYISGKIGEEVAYKFAFDKFVPVSIIIGDMMIDDCVDEIYVSNRYLYKEYYDVKKTIKLKKAKEKVFDPIEFKFRNGSTGLIHIHVISKNEITIILEYMGEFSEYTFYPQMGADFM
ncbi:MAG: hypothetical protein ACK5N8_07510 [Alphaproteobacteria bacterium]